MKNTGSGKFIFFMIFIAAVAGIIWAVAARLGNPGNQGNRNNEMMPVPVEVAEIVHGPIELRRMFSGSLEARAEFVVAPKVSGRVENISVNLADRVNRGQVVAELDNDEYIQAVAQAKADLAVARADLAEAKSALEIVTRAFERVQILRKRGVASDSELDVAMADQTAKQAALEVANARLKRAEALLETANIRLGYTKVTAGWTGGTDQRVVAERFVDEGVTVSANTALLLIVEFDPITGVVYVTEKDYVFLKPGQEISLTTDAFPEEKFHGHIDRIAPVFRQSTRQARVELTIDNPQLRLKPGMFIRATVVLDSMEDAIIIPEQALTKRGDQTGVFVVNEDNGTVSWRKVNAGIRAGESLQVEGEGLTGRVVTLGQQLIDEGSRILIPGDGEQSRSPGEEAVSR